MRQCRFIKPLLLRTAPDPVSNRPRDLAELLYLGKRFHDLGEREMAETIRFWTMSIGEFLDQYFETEVVKAHFAGSGIIGTGLGVYSPGTRSEEHTSELQSLMRISYAVFCLKKKKHNIEQ